jgi:PTS system nitrogen regulatory IIA component
MKSILERSSDLFRKLKKRNPVKISNYLDINTISFLECSSREEALSSLVSVLKKNKKIENEKIFHKAIITRENVVSTGIGMNVAIPHAKLDDFQDFFIAIGIQKNKGLEWDTLDKSLVRIIFMIGGPDNKQNEYLQILSHITSVIKNEILRKKLLNFSSSQEVLELFSSC